MFEDKFHLNGEQIKQYESTEVLYDRNAVTTLSASKYAAQL